MHNIYKCSLWKHALHCASKGWNSKKVNVHGTKGMQSLAILITCRMHQQHATAETSFLVSWVYPNQSMTVIENCEQGMEITISSDISLRSQKVQRTRTQQLSHFPLPSLSHLTSLTHVAALQLTKQGWLHAVCKPITLFHWLWPPVDWIWFWFRVLTL